MNAVTPPDGITNPAGSMPVLQKWFGDDMVWMYGSLPVENPPWLLMNCPVWGSYVKPFIDYVIPTILSPANLEAITPCWILIHTDAQGWPAIWEAMHRLEPHGVKIILRLIPDTVLQNIAQHNSNKYWSLAVSQNLGMRLAGRIGAGYHMLMPDHLYGPHYFRGLKRLSPHHDVIAQTGVSATMAVLPELVRWKHPQGWITVPDIELGQLAWQNLHPQTRAYIMNVADPPNRMPGAHFLCWQGRDALHTYCCHQNAVWLSPRVCLNAPNFIPATIDTRLPHFAAEFYTPVPADEMTFIEFSGDNKYAAKELVNAEQFAARCWAQVGFSAKYMPHFMVPSLTPLYPQATYMTDEEIALQHQGVADALIASAPPPWMETMQQLMMGGT